MGEKTAKVLLIEAGKKGWFEVKFNGADVATFVQPTAAYVTDHSESW